MKTDSANSLNLKEIFPFPLDDFQKQAIAALQAGKSVVVTAPTGSGKTLIGEYAIYRALAQGQRVFYTTPLKALSNQKFRDFYQKFGNYYDDQQEDFKAVGLITGDILINPEASIVVMTTEIFRNMLYETTIGQVGTSVRNVQTVVLDECHYISDRGRGTVWEESIIYCPADIQLVALSATIGNPQQLTDWINYVRSCETKKQGFSSQKCELINSDFRPVPLHFYFSDKKGLDPLLNNKQDKLNPVLKSKEKKLSGKRLRKEDCPDIPKIVKQLAAKNMLPAIYIIFSRRGCDGAVRELHYVNLVSNSEAEAILIKLLDFLLQDNSYLQEKLSGFCLELDSNLYNKFLNYFAQNSDAMSDLIAYLRENPEIKRKLIQFLGSSSEMVRAGQLEPLTRGIAAHHAGILPAWKELVETLFEMGLVKIVFATATLAAGINMPARTTVISALKKRSDDGHRLLTPSEFLQIAGRAGRRGMDEVGYVVTVQTPFEGAKDAAILATAKPEPLKSWFAPSYGMVLNLLQKYSIEEAKDLLARSFAEYLAKLKLAPEKKAIAELTTELAKLDVELASIPINHFSSYQKLKERLKEENRLLEILKQQAKTERKREIAPIVPYLEPGSILELKGKYKKISFSTIGVLVTKIESSGQAPYLVCLGNDHHWYVVRNANVSDIKGDFPLAELESLVMPPTDRPPLGRWCKADEELKSISQKIEDYTFSFVYPQQVIKQQNKLNKVKDKIDSHPLQKYPKTGYLIKKNQKRQSFKDKLRKSQAQYKRHKNNSSYYWEEFLNLIQVLQEFEALEEYTPTPLGEAAATIRGENELWLALALMSGDLDFLPPSQLAGCIAALITETPRPDTWTNYSPTDEVLVALGLLKNEDMPENHHSIWEIKRQLNQVQNRYDVAMPVWLELKTIGIVEQWALGVEWNELCENTSLDEGDIVRLLRRTVDVLWQIPQIPRISDMLLTNARKAVAAMKRFPV